MTPLAQKLYDANKQRYETAADPLRSHGPDHHYRVYQHALKLAHALGVTYDDDILAADVLAEIDFPQAKTEAVLYAIAHHGSDAKYKNEDEPVEVTLLRDADKLDVFGPIGVARIIMVRTLKGDTLQEIVDDFYIHGHLERKWSSITSDVAKEIAKADYEYSKAFFAQLSQTLS